MRAIGAFITPHGFGHATRAIAVLAELQLRYPSLRLQLFTTVPEHLFRQSLNNFTLHRVVPDIGLVQHDALESDLGATVRALDELLPFRTRQVQQLAAAVADCSCILCDIAPLGIQVAETAGIPSVLVENFTWDWIYQPYVHTCPELERHRQALAAIYARATLHIQCEPVCNPVQNAILCPPVFRQVHPDAAGEIRQQLVLGPRKLILVSLGGLDFQLPCWQQLSTFADCYFLLAGQAEYRQITPNCLTLPHQSQFFHPDLVAAADLVVCKGGYSTVAECCQHGTRILCVARPDFAESAILARFVQERLGGEILTLDEFLTGNWLDQLPERLQRPVPCRLSRTGPGSLLTCWWTWSADEKVPFFAFAIPRLQLVS